MALQTAAQRVPAGQRAFAQDGNACYGKLVVNVFAAPITIKAAFDLASIYVYQAS